MLNVFEILACSGSVSLSESCLPPILSLPRLDVLSTWQVSLHRDWDGFHTSQTHVGVAREGVLDDLLVHLRRIWSLYGVLQVQEVFFTCLKLLLRQFDVLVLCEVAG